MTATVHSLDDARDRADGPWCGAFTVCRDCGHLAMSVHPVALEASGAPMECCECSAFAVLSITETAYDRLRGGKSDG